MPRSQTGLEIEKISRWRTKSRWLTERGRQSVKVVTLPYGKTRVLCLKKIIIYGRLPMARPGQKFLKGAVSSSLGPNK